MWLKTSTEFDMFQCKSTKLPEINLTQLGRSFGRNSKLSAKADDGRAHFLPKQERFCFRLVTVLILATLDLFSETKKNCFQTAIYQNIKSAHEAFYPVSYNVKYTRGN